LNLLKTAVKARIPLIAVHTDDPRFAPKLIESITGREPTVIRWQTKPGVKSSISSFMGSQQLGVIQPTEDIKWPETNAWLEESGATLVVVNPETVHPLMFDVGALQVPAEITREFILSITDEPTQPLEAALSGMSITNMRRIAALATASHNEFTPKAIRAVRKAMFPVVRGLEEVDPDQVFYDPPEFLTRWLKIDGKLFKPETHPMLTPRGFLFKGAPGTGKTSGAKYLAQKLKVPLYKLDLGMILGKFVGESDERLISALRQADSFEPCVLLLDEVEKLFEVNSTDNVMPRLLGHMLWWLQEHQSKVLTIMTTNDVGKIPPELFRAGRVDFVEEFQGLDLDKLTTFVFTLAKKLSHLASVPEPRLLDLIQRFQATHTHAGTASSPVNQAVITEEVLGLIKREVIKTGAKQ